MEKLELKHIAPYFPYKLKCQYTDTFREVRIGTLNLIHNDRFGVDSCFDENLKPILHPLSDLTKEIEINSKLIVPIEELNNEIGCEYSKYYDILWINDDSCIGFREHYIPFYEKLFEWHFDVFGLIEKGLAIDINTLYNMENNNILQQKISELSKANWAEMFAQHKLNKTRAEMSFQESNNPKGASEESIQNYKDAELHLKEVRELIVMLAKDLEHFCDDNFSK